MAMTMTITIQNATSYNQTPAGNPWMERGEDVGVTLEVTGNDGDVTWQPIPVNIGVLTPSSSAPYTTATVRGKRFGQTPISVTDAGGNTNNPFTLNVGSLIIAAADGNFWQVYPDGSSRSLPSADISRLITGKMVDPKPPVGVSILARPSTTQAVTCYVLNLWTGDFEELK